MKKKSYSVAQKHLNIDSLELKIDIDKYVL